MTTVKFGLFFPNQNSPSDVFPSMYSMRGAQMRQAPKMLHVLCLDLVGGMQVEELSSGLYIYGLDF